MVADSAKSQPNPAPSAPQPKKHRKPAVPLTFQVRLKARNLYLSQGLATHEIAERTGLTSQQVSNLVYREKLAKIRKRREKGVQEKTDADAQARLELFNKQLAEEAEEISLGALKRAREETELNGENSPRNFQSWTGGIANLVKAARMVRGLDARGTGSGSGLQGDGSNVNLIFVGALERVAPKNLTASATSSATQIQQSEKPVIEIAAAPVNANPNPAEQSQ